MKKIFFPLTITSILFLLSCSSRAPVDQSGLFSISLSAVDHTSFPLANLAEKKASVIIFLQPECPFCNSYGKTLRQLDSVYSQRGIKFIGVVAGKNYPEQEISDFKQKNKLPFTLLLDPDFILKKQLNATTTPEAFLVDNSGKTLYRGLIDNWAYEIGKVRPMVTEHYLTDAADAFLENKKIATDSTKAIGCYIE